MVAMPSLGRRGTVNGSVARTGGVRAIGVDPDLDVGIELLPVTDVEDAVGDMRALLGVMAARPDAVPVGVEPGVRRIDGVEAGCRAALERPGVPLFVDGAAGPAPVLE